VTDADVVGAVSDILRGMGLPELSSGDGSGLAASVALRRELAEVRAEAAAASSALAEAQRSAARAAADAESRRSALQCPICCAHDVDAALVPCGHAVCRECASRLLQQCPFDRAPIRGVIRLFLPQ
jgi:hypothetical protein